LGVSNGALKNGDIKCGFKQGFESDLKGVLKGVYWGY